MSDKFTWIVAEGIEYDTEYDGRMYTVCGYCDAQLSEGEEHKSNCAMMEARFALGNKWPDKVRRSNEAQKHSQPGNKIIQCNVCHKMVNEIGIVQHKRYSEKCKAVRRMSEEMEAMGKGVCLLNIHEAPLHRRQDLLKSRPIPVRLVSTNAPHVHGVTISNITS